MTADVILTHLFRWIYLSAFAGFVVGAVFAYLYVKLTAKDDDYGYGRYE